MPGTQTILIKFCILRETYQKFSNELKPLKVFSLEWETTPITSFSQYFKFLEQIISINLLDYYNGFIFIFSKTFPRIVFSRTYQAWGISIVSIPSGVSAGGVEPPTKFSKRGGGLTRSQFLEGFWERGDDFFQGDCSFYIKIN